ALSALPRGISNPRPRCCTYCHRCTPSRRIAGMFGNQSILLVAKKSHVNQGGMSNPHASSRVHKLCAEEIYEQIANGSRRLGSAHSRDELCHQPNLQPLTNQPSFSPGAVLLLTDGTVL